MGTQGGEVVPVRSQLRRPFASHARDEGPHSRRSGVVEHPIGERGRGDVGGGSEAAGGEGGRQCREEEIYCVVKGGRAFAWIGRGAGRRQWWFRIICGVDLRLSPHTPTLRPFTKLASAPWGAVERPVVDRRAPRTRQ